MTTVPLLRRGLPAVALAAVLCLAGGPDPVSAQENNSLAPFVPTPQDVVDRMLELAGVSESDVVYDRGCGDGPA